MSKLFSTATRQYIALRADYRCEYCKKPEIISNFSFHIEHIIGRQHGGSDLIDNLAYSCSYCNWKKGPNIGTVLTEQGPIIQLFNPRVNLWSDHFSVNTNGLIVAKTEIGEGTLRLLEFNALERIMERQELIDLGFYP